MPPICSRGEGLIFDPLCLVHSERRIWIEGKMTRVISDSNGHLWSICPSWVHRGLQAIWIPSATQFEHCSSNKSLKGKWKMWHLPNQLKTAVTRVEQYDDRMYTGRWCMNVSAIRELKPFVSNSELLCNNLFMAFLHYRQIKSYIST